MSAFDDFVFFFLVFLFSFWRGILISGCFWRYTQRLALVRALSWFILFFHIYFPHFFGGFDFFCPFYHLSGAGGCRLEAVAVVLYG
jgi:hypothetical protein